MFRSFYRDLFLICFLLIPSFSFSQKPNILWITVEDISPTLSMYGDSTASTPNLDELVSRGTTFYNTYIMGAMNGAVCAPSRAMIITGRSLFDINPYA